MKYIVFLGDGMADRPLNELGGLTPLDKAVKPNIDYLARRGICGTVKTVPDGMKPGSDVANLAVMGYDPVKVYSGRAPLEALSIGVNMSATDVAVRCNLVTLSEDADYSEKTMLDYSAGEISSEEARELMAAVNKELGSDICKFYSGVSYRNCLIIADGEIAQLTPPHDISGRVIGEYLPKDVMLLELMEKSYKLLSEHPINIERVKNGKNPANSIWLWGAGSKPILPDFQELYGLKGAVISAVDLLKGIAIAGGMKSIDVAGATGRLDTDWDGKAQACVQAIKDGYDYVYLHMEAADECGHQGDIDGKIKAIEFIDGVVEKVMYELQDLEEGLTVLVAPDHPTPLSLKTHTADSVPFVIYNTLDEKESGVQKYCESECEATGLKLSSGTELMKMIINNTESSIDEERIQDIDSVTEVNDSEANETVAVDNSAMTNELSDTQIGEAEVVCEESSDTVETDDVKDNTEEETLNVEGNADVAGEEIIAPADSAAEDDFILVDESELPVVDEDTATEEGEEDSEELSLNESADETKKKKAKKSKDKKTPKVKGEKKKKEKSPLTKEEKKKRIIIYSVTAVLLAAIIICSIVIPIVIINKDKIFVGKAEDFMNVDDGKYYVLTDDISVDGDLTLPRPYSIDLAGHTLSVSGTLKYESNADESQNIVLGMKDKKDSFAEGVIDVGNLVIDTAGNLEVNAVLNSRNMSLNAKNITFVTGVKVNDALVLSGGEIVFEDNLIFGENGTATLNGVRFLGLRKEARADFYINASKMLMTGGTVIKSATLDGDSEIRVYGTVLGDIIGGRLVVMTKTGSAASIAGCHTLWLHDDSNVGNIETKGMIIEQIKELKAPPTLNVSNENGKILLSIKTVAHAKRYSVVIGDSKFIVKASESDVIVKTDITDYVSTGIGNIRISVTAMGGESEDTDLIVPSIPTVLNYTHEIKLTTPTNAKIVNDNGVYTLSFDSVNFANKYRIEINGNLFETTETTYDITSELAKPGSYSVYIQAVNTENAAIKNSEKALTGIDVYKAFDLPGLQQINNDDGTVAINITAPLAKIIEITYTDAEGTVVTRRMQVRDTVELGRLTVGTEVKVRLIGYGYYTDSTNTITVA